MRIIVQNVWIYFAPQGPSARTLIACYMLVTGFIRVITGNTPAGSVNIFSARMFGVFLLAVGAALFITIPSKFRLRWRGRVAAIATAVLWLLIIGQAWHSQAWVSIGGAFVFVAFMVYEVGIAGSERRVDGQQ